MVVTPYPAESAILPSLEMPEALRFADEFAAAAAALPSGRPWAYVVSCRQGWGTLQYAQGLPGTPLLIAGEVFSTGLATHADSEIVLRASAPIRRLTARVGINDTPGIRDNPLREEKRLVFSVESDGKEVWKGEPMSVESPAQAVDVTLTGGRQEITLRAWDIGGIGDWGHADWVDLALELEGGQVVVPGRPCGFAGQPAPGRPPFRFVFGGTPSDEIGRWEVSHREPKTDGRGRTDTSTVWRDPATGLECEIVASRFERFPAVEWILKLRNTGDADTPLLEDIRPLDFEWRTPSAPTLRTSRGSWYSRTDFLVEDAPLAPGQRRDFEAGGGRSCNATAPFFNFFADGAGMILSIGWTGQWAASFHRSDDGGSVRVAAGQQKTHLVLHPGEEIRTPRIALLFWKGDIQDAHNLQRRFLLAHHTPRPDGRLLRGPLCSFFWGGMTTRQMLDRIDLYRRETLDYDYAWVDAGWYGPPDSVSPDEFTGDWAIHVGNWAVNPAAHPDGLRPVAEAARRAGMGFLVWFEPERAILGTPLTREHPGWFLGNTAIPRSTMLLDLGNPEACDWLIETMDRFIAEQGVTLYRQDFNMDPLEYWRANDAEDRQGITEIRHVEGLYRFWDTLLERHPGLVIDNCASGGRRIDLETVSRSIPLWRSDWQCGWTNEPTPGQTHLMGLSMWVPLSGTGVLGYARRAGDTYNFRCSLGPAVQFSSFSYAAMPIEGDFPWDWWRARIAEFRRAAPFYYGDYYPLTRDTASEGEWAVYQFHRPDLDAGIVAAFRRRLSPFLAASFPLRALDPDATYEFEDADTGALSTATGRELVESGLRIDLESAPSSRLVYYRRAASARPAEG